MGILCEHFAGKWPFWLSPRQILVIPVGVGFYPYAQEVQSIFHQEKMFVDVDLSGNTLQKKIRNGQLSQYNFIFGKFASYLSIMDFFFFLFFFLEPSFILFVCSLFLISSLTRGTL